VVAFANGDDAAVRLRKRGSGLSSATAHALEEILCGRLVGDVRRVNQGVASLVKEYNQGNCGLDPQQLSQAIDSAVPELHIEVHFAEPSPESLLGDVEIVDSDGVRHWIELKAQTKKLARDLLQADWVRDYTDFIAAVGLENDAVAARLSAWGASSSRATGWALPSLWAADLLLLDSATKKARAGVALPDDLRNFARYKYLWHVAQDRAAIYRMDALPAFRRALTGSFFWRTSEGATSTRTYVSTTHSPEARDFEFVYYMYADGIGRHKLHSRVLDEATPVWHYRFA
jgi:hypothetical protein